MEKTIFNFMFKVICKIKNTITCIFHFYVNHRVGVVDKVFARVGANDNVANKQSTFHMEMAETAHILNNATESSFVILDEIGVCLFILKEVTRDCVLISGRGTSPSEGVAIAQSVLEYIHNEVGQCC